VLVVLVLVVLVLVVLVLVGLEATSPFPVVQEPYPESTLYSHQWTLVRIA